MSLNIPNLLTDYAQSVVINMDFNKFTDRQIKNISKQLVNGCLSRSSSATSMIARWLSKGKEFPHFKYDSYYVKWTGIEHGHPFFEALKSSAAMSKLQPDLRDWESKSFDEMLQLAEAQQPKGEIYFYRFPKDMQKVVKKTMKVTRELPQETKDFLEQLQSRTLGVQAINVYDIMYG